jgi:hypothetical protein
MFYVGDELHAEPIGHFASLAEAVSELRRLAAIPWDQEPNRAPCSDWRRCGRHYELVEVSEDGMDRRELGKILSVGAEGDRWAGGYEPQPPYEDLLRNK